MHGNYRLQLSIIIAVYNRKDELRELLNSLINQSDKNFEVIIIDDGSKEKLESVSQEYTKRLDVKYYYKANSGAGLSRNYGSEYALGNYFIFLDSDCITPPNYIKNIRKELYTNYTDAFGGADSADKSFNDLQKAISYSMTSLFTTGGIRGNKKSVNRFQPRSFNMGISKEAFNAVGGFSEMRIGEDPDLSLSLWEKGFQTRFFSECEVFHKRRTSIKKFSNQVYHFGIARPILNKRHPKYVKVTFWFPSLFLIFTIISIIAFFFKWYLISPLLFYCGVIIIDSSLKNKSLKVGLLSLATTFVQFFSYGYGFLQSFIRLNIFREDPNKAFPSHFY